MRVLGVVTARGGSKGIPRKNLAPLLGRPLLAWTADVALASRSLSRVVLSTDDEEIADVGRGLGLEVPFLRPAELAGDDTTTIDVLVDVASKLEEAGDQFDAVFTLQPTNPLRIADDVNGAVALLSSSGADSVIGFSEVGDAHPARMKTVDAEGWVWDPSFCESLEGQARQQLPRYFLRNGAVYVTRRDVLVGRHTLKGERCRAWLIPAERAVNIDTPLDLEIAGFLLQRILAR